MTTQRARQLARAGILIGCLVPGVATLHHVYGQSTPAAKPDQGANLLPDGAGKQLVQTKCLVCHGAGMITGKRGTTDDWNQTINEMISHGAIVSDDEADTILNYLSSHFPASQAAPANATSPADGTQTVPAAAAGSPPAKN